MKYAIVVFFLLSLANCAGFLTKGDAFQDCITTHLRILSRNSVVSQPMYNDIVDACRQAHTGRP